MLSNCYIATEVLELESTKLYGACWFGIEDSDEIETIVVALLLWCCVLAVNLIADELEIQTLAYTMLDADCWTGNEDDDKIETLRLSYCCGAMF